MNLRIVESSLIHVVNSTYFSTLEEARSTYLTCLILHGYTVVDSGVDTSSHVVMSACAIEAISQNEKNIYFLFLFRQNNQS